MNSSTTRRSRPVPPEGRLTVAVLGAGHYRVEGGARPHVVMIGTDVVRCDCADVHYRRRPCKHIRAVTAYLVAAPIVPCTERITRDTGAGPGLSDCDVPPPEPERAA